MRDDNPDCCKRQTPGFGGEFARWANDTGLVVERQVRIVQPH
jgi:hypothetical protein